MKDIVQQNPRQATLNQIANVVEYARFGSVGTKGSFTSANGGISVDITNTRDGCGGGTTLDVKVFWHNQPTESKFFRDPALAEAWLNDVLVPAESTAVGGTDERGHTYAPVGGYRNPATASAPVPQRAPRVEARC